MVVEDYLNYPISDRHRLLRESGNAEYLYIIFKKHLRKSIEELKGLFNIEYSMVTDEVKISGTRSNVYYIFGYLSKFGVKFNRITPTEISMNGNHLLTLIY